MSCCGKKRQAYKAWLKPRPIRLRYIGAGTVAFTGLATGKAYFVSESAPEIDVDPNDASGLLRDGLFIRA
ncbi:MAG TPA: hypothetical protein VGL00_20060 [Terracidiphilus sp.]